jgi:GH43 family beta-xylosidase
VLTAVLGLSSAGTAQAGQTGLRAADPSVLRVGGTYISVQSVGDGIAIRQASSTDALASAPARRVWSDATAPR